jgi:hypothetical protein
VVECLVSLTVSSEERLFTLKQLLRSRRVQPGSIPYDAEDSANCDLSDVEVLLTELEPEDLLLTTSCGSQKESE